MRFLRDIGSRLSQNNTQTWCHIEERHFTYADLYAYLKTIQNPLLKHKGAVGVVLRNDFETYASLIACWLSGRAYVPLNPSYPKQRLVDIIEASNLGSIIDSHGIEFAESYGCEWISQEKNETTQIHIAEPDKTDWAYILFTSGTTGKPKGVPISFGNLQAFFDGFFDLGYSLDANDRFLQMFELTFDLSVMSFGVPTLLGASFYVPSKQIIKPLALYDCLESHDISFALMVPSAVDLLAPYIDELDLPNLKISQFCGEALKLNQVKLWAQACPKTQIDNVYGPTEATIYCTRYTVPTHIENTLHHNGIVCIGNAMKHVQLEIQTDGELCLGGLQTTEGYLHATNEQKSKFYESNGIWYYKSGDTASFLEGNYYCHGRNDDQIKIQGYRVELSEIEFAAAKLNNSVSNRCIAIETENGWELHIVYELAQTDISAASVNAFLPDYMHIKGVHAVHPFPLNDNGKVDRKAIKTLITSSL